jgi:hypothetical protein
MIEIIRSESLKESPGYQFYKNALNIKYKNYLKLGYSDQLTSALLDFDEDISGLVYAEIDNKIKGCLCYSKEFIEKKVMTVYLTWSCNQEVDNLIYCKFENYSQSIGCFIINEIVPVKDQLRLDELESKGFFKEFYLMYKKI